MSKKLIISIILLVYVIGIFNQVIPLLSYSVNFDYIVKELCVEKDKEVNICLGSCHLTEEIKKAFNQEEKPDKKVSTDVKELNQHWLAFHKISFVENHDIIEYSSIQEKYINSDLQTFTPPPKTSLFFLINS